MRNTINESFFEELNEESAYVLGFIWADGCLSRYKNTDVVSIDSSDYQIISDIKEVIDFSGKIIEYKCKSGTVMYRITISNKRVIKSLMDLGLVYRKSLIIGYPSIDKELERHFIRGYFDGNGHFTMEQHKKCSKRVISGFTIGSEAFVKALVLSLHGFGLKLANIQHIDRRGKGGHGQYYQIRYYQKDTERLYDLMYEGATIYLHRKKESFESKKKTIYALNETRKEIAERK